ncbi:MAG: lysylphosphatidylglycerol synthase transmembrane domain-containing protein [Gaiellaceae bacterium]
MAKYGLPQRKLEGAALVAAAAVLAFAASFGVAWAAGFDYVAHALTHPHWPWIFVALGGEALAYFGYALAYREVARVEEGPKLPPRRAVALVAAGFAPFVAGGGFHVDLLALRRSGVGAREARVRVLGLGALEYAVLAPAACATAIFLLQDGTHLQAGLTWPWAVAVPVGFAAAALALPFRDRFRGRGLRDGIAHGLDAVNVLRCVVVRPRDHGAAAFTGTALYWFGDMIALWACLYTFLGHAPWIPHLILGYATGYALTRRTLPLGGAGAVEALLPFALSWMGMPLAVAVLGVFAYRFFNLWLPLIPALAAVSHVRDLPARLEA